ncbi:phage tail tape measure C-terminal domain-containing protein [Variovorax sp. UMC13]|uniref:phage tail tape measure C-terminal domain-containing protein n=1 Tax=Variovorax sp. UMC13 TaxID=1862326 RepID=UPI0015FFE2F3|nr:phage tail tape measure C-terminal domain-containing protein [Variovorax sp. UMC13]MBB1599476.1 hypothetical protein [Variovorax sp. UMC13]
MTDFASLGIRIDSSQAKAAQTELEKLVVVGEKAEKAIDDLGAAGKRGGTGINETGKATTEAGRSIDQFVNKVEKANKATTEGAKTTKVYGPALVETSKAQEKVAASAEQMAKAYELGTQIGDKLRSGFISTAKAALQLGAALTAAGVGGAVLFNKVADSIAKYQDLADKTGETAANIASLQTAADLSGTSLDTVASASVRLTSALAKTDDESKLVAKGIKALGLNFDEFKKLAPAQQLDAVAKSMSEFANGSEKTAAAVAIFGKSGAELIPFLNDLADGGERQLRLTDEQIKAADDYTKAQARLKSEISQLAQVIVAESIPAVTDFTGALKDGITSTLGLGDAAKDLKGNGAIASFAEEGVRFLANLLDMADKVVFAFQYVGKSIGATAAIAASAARGEFAAISGIIDAAREDGERLLNRPNFAEALDKRAAQRQADAARKREEERGFSPGLPRIDVSGLNTDKSKTDKSASQIAKAQLAYDLEDIRKAQDALANTISNGEKLLEARRSANLVSEAAYWQQKRAFLVQNDAAQADSLVKEIARLEQEKLSGKDKIDNDRKILDAQSKLAKVRENASANLQVLAIKEQDALDKIRIKYEEAAVAAKSYTDTIARANDREIAGLGRGSQNREVDARRSQREDQFQSRKEQLDTQRRANQITSEEYEKFLAIEKSAFERSIALDAKYWEQKRAVQEDGIRGAQEGLQNYIDEVNNSFERGNRLVTDGLQGFNASLADSLYDGNLDSFKSFGERMGKQILAGVLEQQITKPIAEWLQGSLKDEGSIVGKLIGGLTGTKGTGENWLGSLLGGGKDAAGAAGATAAATSQAALATSATAATASISALAAAAASAAVAMGGSSISSALGLANGVGASGGDALGSLIASMGWADGGYTGDGAKYQPAGIVHAGEYVVNAENTRRLGVSFLERLNRRGYADGGYVGSVMGGNLNAAAGNTTDNSKVEVHNHFAAGTDNRTIDQATLKLARVLNRSQRNA